VSSDAYAAYGEDVAASYDERHADRATDVEAATRFLVALAAGGRVLELGVGTGRVALPLAQEGVAVDGIDASDAMLARLRTKPDGARVGITVGDFTVVDQLVTGPYRLVFVVFNTLFELPSQDAQARCFEGVARVLAPGGRFVVEAIAPDATRLEQGLAVAGVSADRVVLDVDRHDPVAQVTAGAQVGLGPDGVRLRPRRLRYATVPELDLMARLAGLRLRGRWGGWRGEPFTAASNRHVSVYERP
jgi:SAM-dependent methyltransferase